MTGSRRGQPRLVSVVIPCRNASGTLPQQLDALASQTYDGPWEVVLVDNGSTDGSARLALERAAELPALRVITTGDKGVSRVRNAGVRGCGGDLLALCDADDVVVPEWLAALVREAAEADLVGGSLDDTALNSPQSVSWRGLRPQGALLTRLDHLPYAPGGNCAVWRDVFDSLDGWDPSFVGGSDDVDFSWRALARGYRLAYAPDAVIHYRYRGTVKELGRQYFRYGYSEAQLQKRFGDDLPRHRMREFWSFWFPHLRNVRHLRLEGDAPGIWMRDAGFHLGRLWGSIRMRVLLP
jgi:glycosyltransferase involved in cell wall biosynthesis